MSESTWMDGNLGRALGRMRPSASGSVPAGAAVVASQIMMAAAGVLSARALGPDGKGVVTAITTWMAILPWIGLAGFNTAASVRVAGDPQRELRRALGNALVYSAAVGGVVAIVAFVTLPGVVAHLGHDAEPLMRAAALTIPLGILSEVLVSLQLALGRTRVYIATRLLPATVLLGGSVALVAADAATTAGFVALAIGAGVLSLLATVVRLPWSAFAVAPGELLADVRFGAKVALAGWLGLANLRFDLLIMSAFISADEIGLYGVANNVMVPVATIASTAAGFVTPAAARNAGTASMAQRAAAVHREASAHVGLGLAGGIALAAVAAPLVPWVFGDEFDGAVALVWILIPGYVLRNYATIAAAGAAGLRRPWVGNVAEAAAFAVTAAMLPFLLEPLEAQGAAITSSASYATAALVAALALRRLRREPGPAEVA
jgi:O-antigen/teichoic acid export membrane protein